MGLRVGALWRKKGDDGIERITGTLECDAGINLPAGQKLGLSIVKNEKKDSDRHPDFHVEVFVQRDRE